MFKYIYKIRYRLIISSIFYLILAVFLLLPFDFFGEIIDGINNKTIGFNGILTKVTIMLLITFLDFILNGITELIVFRSYDKYIYVIQKEILQKVMKQTPQYFNKMSIGEVMSRMLSDVNEYIAQFLSWGIYCFGVGVIQNIVILAYIIYKVDYKFAILINLPYIIVTIFIITQKRNYENKYKSMAADFDIISKKTLENIKGIRIIRAYNMIFKIREKYLENLEKYTKSNLSFSMYHAYQHATNVVAVAFSYFILIIYGYYSYSHGFITFGTLLGVSLIMTLLAWPYTVLALFFFSLFEYKIGLNRVNEILEADEVVDENTGHKKLLFSKSIEFRDFNFSFENKKALKNISFTLNKGETLGIVGKTGSGKTTLIKQLLRLYENNGGIYIDGIDIKEYDIKSLRSNFGYSPQEYYIFSKTIEENILFHRNLSDNLDNALVLADLKKDIENFENGIKTIVGENGVSLSGGQKQRLSIARAIISEPEILILDDSLSALDTNTEKNIIENLEKNRKGKTNIIVSHRISSVINADKILILNSGVIENIGTHKELLESSDWYRKLYEYQNRKEENLEREELFD